VVQIIYNDWGVYVDNHLPCPCDYHAHGQRLKLNCEKKKNGGNYNAAIYDMPHLPQYGTDGGFDQLTNSPPQGDTPISILPIVPHRIPTPKSLMLNYSSI